MSRCLLLVASLTIALLLPSIFVGEALESNFIDYGGLPVTATLNVSLQTNSTSLVMLVVVNSTIYEAIKESLENYEKDLKDGGFEDVIVVKWSQRDPKLLREVLKQFYSNSSLAGALLVGDIPVAEYEMFSMETGWGYERFPTDLYYMDLDGNWTDSDRDGILDSHFGKKIAPDIWVGRIKTSNLGVDEVSLINKYFEKNHQYRNGILTSLRRGLLYLDDDWTGCANMDAESLGVLYRNLTTVADEGTTNVTDYRNRLKESYEWLHVRSHGSWNRHGFSTPGGAIGAISSTEYESMDPQVLFYQLFVCSAGRFTEPNYLAGEAVFKTNKGLLAMSSTKMGGMLMFWTFYEALANGRTIGEAFKEWFVRWGEGQLSFDSNYVGRKWFYGLTIIGDPALRLRWLGQTEIAELQRLEEESVNDLPLVQNLRNELNASETDYLTLNSDYNSLKGSHSDLQVSLKNVADQLASIRNLLYFFLLVTAILAVSNISHVRGKSKPETRDYT